MNEDRWISCEFVEEQKTKLRCVAYGTVRIVIIKWRQLSLQKKITKKHTYR